MFVVIGLLVCFIIVSYYMFDLSYLYLLYIFIYTLMIYIFILNLVVLIVCSINFVPPQRGGVLLFLLGKACPEKN